MSEGDKNDTTDYYIYVRTTCVGAQSDRLEVLKGQCRAFGDRKGWALQGVYADEGVSGLKILPGIEKLSGALKSRNFSAAVVVHDFTQLGRSVETFTVNRSILEKSGAKIVNCQHPELSAIEFEFMGNVKAAQAELQEVIETV